jgi:hypothetical protein
MDIRFFGMKYGTSSKIQLEHVKVQGTLREHVISVIDGKTRVWEKTWNLEFKPKGFIVMVWNWAYINLKVKASNIFKRSGGCKKTSSNMRPT